MRACVLLVRGPALIDRFLGYVIDDDRLAFQRTVPHSLFAHHSQGLTYNGLWQQVLWLRGESSCILGACRSRDQSGVDTSQGSFACPSTRCAGTSSALTENPPSMVRVSPVMWLDGLGIDHY